jgi:hypothetical protein
MEVSPPLPYSPARPALWAGRVPQVNVEGFSVCVLLHLSVLHSKTIHTTCQLLSLPCSLRIVEMGLYFESGRPAKSERVRFSPAVVFGWMQALMAPMAALYPYPAQICIGWWVNGLPATLTVSRPVWWPAIQPPLMEQVGLFVYCYVGIWRKVDWFY